MFINYLIDPFEVFQTKFLKQSPTPNLRFVKTQYLMNNYNKYDSYILGSSRAGVMSPGIFEKHIPNSKFYNLWIDGATLYDFITIPGFLGGRGYRIRNLILLFDMDRILPTTVKRESNPISKPPYYMENSNKYFWYLFYLKMFPADNIFRKIKNSFNEPKEIYDVENSGMIFYPKLDEMIKKNYRTYYKNEKSLNVNKVSREIKADMRNLENIREMLNLYRALGVNLIIVIAPLNYNLVNKIDTFSYTDFLSRLSQITNYWDFGGYNSVTLNNRNYYESSHFMPLVSEMMIARIFNDKAVDVPADFGCYITGKNINEHVINLTNQFKRANDQWK